MMPATIAVIRTRTKTGTPDGAFYLSGEPVPALEVLRQRVQGLGQVSTALSGDDDRDGERVKICGKSFRPSERGRPSLTLASARWRTDRSWGLVGVLGDDVKCRGDGNAALEPSC